MNCLQGSSTRACMQGERLGLVRRARSPQIYENLHLLDIMTVLRKTRYLSHDLFLTNVSRGEHSIGAYNLLVLRLLILP